MTSVNIFTERNKKAIFNRKIEVSIPSAVRQTLCNLMNKYDITTDSYDEFYPIQEMTLEELRIYYKIEYVEKGKIIECVSLSEFLPNTYPSRTFDALEVFSLICKKSNFVEEVNYIFQNNELPYELTKGRINVITNIVISKSLTEDMEIAKKDIEANIIKGNFQLVVGTLHTYFGYFIETKLQEKSLDIPKDTKGCLLLSQATKTYKEWLKTNTKIDEFQEQAIVYAGALMDKYNTIRNTKTLAHPNQLIDNDSAEFLTKVVSAILMLFDKVDK